MRYAISQQCFQTVNTECMAKIVEMGATIAFVSVHNSAVEEDISDCGIMHGNKSDGGPHLHNLRHTFCVHSLEAMLRNGIPHQVALPLLMTYLGHSSLSATGRYLKLTAEAFPDLVDQINRIYADIIPDLEVKTEYEDD